jgi:hypothetical protein
MPEMVLMMRTLRDMNLSKLIAEDVPLFLSLIADLFPGLTAAKAAFPEITAAMKKAADASNLQYDNAPEWAGKCIQLLETYYVRHGIGRPGPPFPPVLLLSGGIFPFKSICFQNPWISVFDFFFPPFAPRRWSGQPTPP